MTMHERNRGLGAASGVLNALLISALLWLAVAWVLR
jgi:hypothetical protein